MLLADMDGVPSSFMPAASSTIKLVVIGPSGVGKTSLRGQYISGRFSTGYRATIGADFITKTLPHPTRPDESVVLQIWDTAGQERFSSLSSAFFRGADAAILCFDANDRESMRSLLKWWDEFRQRTPVADEVLEEYCCVVVGNKKDLVKDGAEGAVGVTEAEAFLEELVPIVARAPVRAMANGWRTPPPPQPEVPPMQQASLEFPSKAPSSRPASPLSGLSPSRVRSKSISIVAPQRLARHSVRASCSPSERGGLSRSRSRSSSRFYAGTMTTTATGMSIYHTPSSSVFDIYHSARASPEPSISPSGSYVRSRRSTAASASTVTITPSLFAREHQDMDAMPLQDASPELGPRLFFASAKTGENVSDIFEYVARRVVRRWEREERRMGFGEDDNPSVVHLNQGEERGRQRRGVGACCTA